ncbi:MAG: ethanolamine utilization microcompartment protein EutL [Clostridiales Family XIII bacterium]|jgi:ethanolamine utilization protein EutL|nr:ethanolamine utilization microcompartment protein EutL [Clostridiales Family XIII bacterium]
MRGYPVRTRVLSSQLIPGAARALLAALGAPPGHRSLGLITTDCDDVSYVALDEATKHAEVRVVYARSMYAGAANASTALAGEFLGVISGSGPEDVKSGLLAAERFCADGGCFYSANDDGSIVYFAHCISRAGAYLSALAGIPEGDSLAYLIAPPSEALVGLDTALKTSATTLKLFYGPPTETNFAGGLLTGEQSACRAACQAFSQAVLTVAGTPLAVTGG